MTDFDLDGAMPFDLDASDAQPGVLAVEPFLYIGVGHTAQSFGRYVQTYPFGRIPPDSIVLHHTAIPSMLAARYPSGAVWDAGEDGMREARVYQKRTKQLDALANYYQSLGWDRGPHLFIDDKYIWLFTPMNAVGIHAKEGNSYRDAAGKLHYSIGIEVIGYYEHTTWPEPVAANVRAAVQVLCDKLGIAPIYRPGPLHSPAAHTGSMSSHRDFNKPQCPGAAITEAYYTSVIAPPEPPKAYKVLGVPVFESQSCTGRVAVYLPHGLIVGVDKVYPEGVGHLVTGAGFIRLDASVEAL